MRRPRPPVFIALAALLLLVACDNDLPEGLGPSPEADRGPRVIFDLDHKPLPEIPLPNDAATRLDPTSPTGRRINLSVIAPSELEETVRDKANNLDGFATFGAATVAFDAPLDVPNIIARHQQNLDFEDDAVFIINIDPDHPDYGQATPLDFGRGNFPVNLSSVGCYYPGDARCDAANLIFETVDEDLNKNGILDPGEDTDDDGVLDKPNLLDPSLPEDDALISFYEFQTNTLIIRPILPLASASHYAVVLTRRLVGVDGEPVRSPFPYVNHARQSADLAPLPGFLEELGVAPEEIAFAWTFTTQSSQLALDTIRAGLHGEGTMAWLAREFPVGLDRLFTISDRGQNPFITRVEDHVEAFRLMAGLILGDNEVAVQGLVDELSFIDYLVAGEVTVPYFLADKDGLVDAAPEGSYWDNPYRLDDDESFEVDPVTGEAFQRPAPLDFLCTVPKAHNGYEAPFPVVIMTHGTGVGKFSLLAFAGGLARFGIATCGVDGIAHGLAIGDQLDLARLILEGEGVGGLLDVLIGQRMRDLDMDGAVDVAGDFWTVDAFHTRDTIRQTVVDNMTLTRLLLSFDGQRPWSEAVQGAEGADALGQIAGDWDGDGVVDIGGPASDYFAFGMSLGGIVTTVFAGSEPVITAAAPEVGGGGLSDIAIRSTQTGVPHMVILPLMGPLFIGEPTEDGTETEIYFLAGRFQRYERIVIGRVPRLQPGEPVTITNLASGEAETVHVHEDGRFNLAVQAWARHATEIGALHLPDGPMPNPKQTCAEQPEPGSDVAPCVFDTTRHGDPLALTIGEERMIWDRFQRDTRMNGIIYPEGAQLVALQGGFGYQRQTPELRRFALISQTLLDQADPINYAPRLSQDTAWRGGGVVPSLYTNAIGDTNVPIATGISMARAGGVIDWRPGSMGEDSSPNDYLIERYVVEGLARLKRYDPPLYDPDDLDLGTDRHNAVSPEEPLRLTVSHDDGRVSGLRMFYQGRNGGHSFAATRPDRQFNHELFMINMIGAFFESRGAEIRGDLCLATATCEDTPTRLSFD